MIERLASEKHDTLDGVLEPAENTRLVGHLETQRMILAAQRAGRLPHAIILAGPQGIGKATFAFHLARHLLSRVVLEGERFGQSDPASSLFRQVASGSHPAVLHLTRPANDKGTGFKTVLAVDEVRRIGHFLSMTAHDGGYRIVIVDPADDLRNAAANALLKNLEEPPRNTLFVLISHNLGRLLPTIRSRCQVLRMNPLTHEELGEVLTGVDDVPQKVDERAALFQRAAGSVRTALVLHQHGGLEIAATVDELVKNPGDLRTVHKLAEAVSGKDRAIQFAIFNDHALSLLSRAAETAAEQGEVNQAKMAADAWQEARIAISDTETYNLDQKQHALTMIGRLNRTLLGGSRRM